MNERLKKIRTSQGLTQCQMAQKMGFTHPAYNRLEKGKAPLNERHCLLLSSLFNVNEEWLKTGKGNIYNSQCKQTSRFVELYDQLPTYCKKYVITCMIQMIKEFPSDIKTNNS